MAAEIRGHDVGARVGLAVLLDKMESASSTRVPEAGALRRARRRGQRKECRDRPALQPGKVDNQCVEKIPPVVFRWMDRGPPTVGRYPGPICGASARVVAKRLDCSRWADDCSLTTPLMPARVPRKTIFTGGDACDCHR